MRGGHIHGSKVPDATTFPEGWDEDRLIAEILDVGRIPEEPPEQDRSGTWVTRGTRDDVYIEVRIAPSGLIRTGCPISGPGVGRNGMDAPLTYERALWMKHIQDANLATAAFVEAVADRLPEQVSRSARSALAAGEPSSPWSLSVPR